jgi:choline dehydrogenase-like flavoprotein
MRAYDSVFVGTGMGGGTQAYALRDSGLKILLLERGDYLPSEAENWSPEAVFKQKRYKPKEEWFDDSGHTFPPGVHYFVGDTFVVACGAVNSTALLLRCA